MRTSILVSSFAALIAAQSIEFDQIVNAPAVKVTAAPVTGTAQSVSAQPSGAASTVGANAVQSSSIAQRDLPSLSKRDGDCSQQPAGTGPPVHSPDTSDAFEKFQYFTASAYSAPIPKGYALNFTNLKASTSTSSYMGYTTLNKYDTAQCASLCNQQTGCVAFNLYFERDPTLDPNGQSCPNPPSLTNIKCVFWGVPISGDTATNSGQYRDSFQVVIAGSNGYNAIAAPPSYSGWTGPYSWNGAGNVPNDPSGNYSTYIGSKFFSFGTASGQVQYVNSEVCASACSAQTAYNFANPPSDSSNPTVCNHVVAYMLSDGKSIPQGMYCAMYTESWDPSYGTITQSVYQGETWTIQGAYVYMNATYSSTYQPIQQPNGYAGGNCGGWGAGTC